MRAEEPDRIDSGRQVAIYHIAAEGVLNAFPPRRRPPLPDRARAPGRRRVRLTVADDGIGGLDEATPGIGLASMRERTAELGGSFAIDSSEKGATVTVVLP